MESEPWEALDVDESDLSAFLRPCNRNTSETTADPPHPLIPGPAGVIQAAMMQRRAGGGESNILLPTQEFVRRVVQDGYDSDRDFKSNPWLSALNFLRSEEASATPLSSIKRHPHLTVERVSRVVAVIKSCTPNGFGDMTVTLKDPTGTVVGASIHRRVFAEGGFGKDDITVGSVLLLQKVALFSPDALLSAASPSCYLNITLPNILKVFSKDSGPPSIPISVVQTAPTSTETHKMSWMPPDSAFSLLQGGTEVIPTSLRLDSMFMQVADNSKQTDQILVLTSCPPHDGNHQNQNSVSDRESLSPKLDRAGTVEITCIGELENKMEDQSNLLKLGEGDSFAGLVEASPYSTNFEHISDGQENGIKIPMERQKDIMNPTSSIPVWTEEQLDELFAFD